MASAADWMVTRGAADRVDCMSGSAAVWMSASAGVWMSASAGVWMYGLAAV